MPNDSGLSNIFKHAPHLAIPAILDLKHHPPLDDSGKRSLQADVLLATIKHDKAAAGFIELAANSLLLECHPPVLQKSISKARPLGKAFRVLSLYSKSGHRKSVPRTEFVLQK